MKAPNRLGPPRRGELDIHLVRFTKLELKSIPQNHRSFYLILGQLNNEVTMLQSLVSRSLSGVRGSIAEKETALGVSFFLMRLLAGRLYETSSIINDKQNAKLLELIWNEIPSTAADRQMLSEADAGKRRLNKMLGGNNSLLKLIRHKQAFHNDQAVMDDGFSRLPEDAELTEFDTNYRGSTFFGISDTVAAIATSGLQNKDGVLDGARVMVKDVTDAVNSFQNFSFGYMLGVVLRYFGPDRLSDAETVRLKGLEAGRSPIGYFLSSPSKGRLAEILNRRAKEGTL